MENACCIVWCLGTEATAILMTSLSLSSVRPDWGAGSSSGLSSTRHRYSWRLSMVFLVFIFLNELWLTDYMKEDCKNQFQDTSIFYIGWKFGFWSFFFFHAENWLQWHQRLTNAIAICYHWRNHTILPWFSLFDLVLVYCFHEGINYD